MQLPVVIVVVQFKLLPAILVYSLHFSCDQLTKLVKNEQNEELVQFFWDVSEIQGSYKENIEIQESCQSSKRLLKIQGGRYVCLCMRHEQ